MSARVAMGASDQQTLNALLEADAYNGPSLIIAYSHCIAHGYDLRMGLEQQKLAVASGAWPLYRYNPALIIEGQNPLSINSKSQPYRSVKYAYNKSRYRMLLQSDEQRAEMLMKQAQKDVSGRWDSIDRWPRCTMKGTRKTSKSDKEPQRVTAPAP